MNYVWWCLLFVGGTGGSRASIIRRRGYIPADGAPVANKHPCEEDPDSVREFLDAQRSGWAAKFAAVFV